jgi:predicted dehydrogenase
MQYCVGLPEKVSGSILKNIYSKNVDDAVYTSLQLQNGISGQLCVNWSDETYRKMSTQLTILAKKGKIIVDAQELKVYLKEKPDKGGYEKGWNMRWLTDLSPEVGFYLRGEEYSAQIEFFIECVKKGKASSINSFISAHMTDKVVDLIKKDFHEDQYDEKDYDISNLKISTLIKILFQKMVKIIIPDNKAKYEN